MIVHPQEKAESFNKYFNSTFTSSNPSASLDLDNLQPPSNFISQIEITIPDIFDALCSLDCTKSFDCDNIHPRILKFCAESLLKPIHHIFQLIVYLSTSTLPREWKIHKITPIPKKGDLSCIKNYRPISLLCIISKILESVIYKRNVTFIQPKLNQFGFTKGKSCLAQLLTVFSTINQAINNQKSADIMYLDFRKAFDSVPHLQLLFKLWQIGIIGPLRKLLRCYLTNRLHYIYI